MAAIIEQPEQMLEEDGDLAKPN
jgi:hypothetical protein